MPSTHEDNTCFIKLLRKMSGQKPTYKVLRVNEFREVEACLGTWASGAHLWLADLERLKG